jgi:hypothetical protein
LRTFSAIMIAVPGNFAHPTAIGFMESIHWLHIDANQAG